MYLLYSALAIAEWEMESINKQYNAPTQPGNVKSLYQYVLNPRMHILWMCSMRWREKKPEAAPVSKQTSCIQTERCQNKVLNHWYYWDK